MVKIYKQPFAHGGDTIAIPDASQPDGKMSGADGWTPDYQLPKTDPNYKPVGRQEMNGVLYEITEALGQVQVQGSATWSAEGAPYPVNAQVYHSGKQWISLRANSVEPVEGADWAEFSAAAINNKLDKSAVVQTTGNSTTDIMSQKSVSDQLFGVGQTWQDVLVSRSINTNYTNSTNKAIFVSITATDSNIGAATAFVQGVRVGIVDTTVGSWQFSGTISFPVPPGATYRLEATAAQIIESWSELS